MREHTTTPGTGEGAAAASAVEADTLWAVSLGVPSASASRLLEGLVPHARRLVVIDERATRGRALPGVPFENVVAAPARAGSALHLLLALVRLAPCAPRAVLLLWHPEGTRVPLEPAEPALRQALERVPACPHEVFLLAHRGAGEGTWPSLARLGPRLRDGTFLIDALEQRATPCRAAFPIVGGVVGTRPLLVARHEALLEMFEASLGIPIELLPDSDEAHASRSWFVRGLHEATPPAELERDVLGASTERLRLILDEP